MKLSISNIGWSVEQDEKIYALMQKYEYSGLEIAPTRVFLENPYDNLDEKKQWYLNLKAKYGFSIPSMQSIWYGREEKIFGSIEERTILFNYTKKAIDFASAISCKNLVFGCPKNRKLPEGADIDLAVTFFKELGDYAAEKNTVIGLEANPTIYHTNYINDTKSAIELIKQVNSKGFRLNLDIGTIIYNGENIIDLEKNVSLINHVHISEPELQPIEKRNLHYELKKLLDGGQYSGFISIEVKKTDDISMIEDELKYIKGVFYDL